jgi:hypothetical protein
MLRLPVDLAANHGLYEQAGFLEREGLQLEVLAAVVLPERDDRVRGRLTCPDRGDHGCLIRGGQLLDEHRRRRIEEMRVVDEQRNRAAILARDDRFARSEQEVEQRRRHIGVRRQQVRERAERNRAAGLCRRHAHGRVARVLRGAHHLLGQPRLADPRRASHDDPPPLPAREERPAEGDLLAAADQWPRPRIGGRAPSLGDTRRHAHSSCEPPLSRPLGHSSSCVAAREPSVVDVPRLWNGAASVRSGPRRRGGGGCASCLPRLPAS